jgi:hypothetical protein
MNMSDVISIVAFLLALSVMLFIFWRSASPFTLSGLQETYKKSESLAAELEKVGLMAVVAVEQLKDTGVINTNEAAFTAAFDYINSWPGMEKLDRVTIAHAVEGSYRLYKMLEAKHGKETGVPD